MLPEVYPEGLKVHPCRFMNAWLFWVAVTSTTKNVQACLPCNTHGWVGGYFQSEGRVPHIGLFGALKNSQRCQWEDCTYEDSAPSSNTWCRIQEYSVHRGTQDIDWEPRTECHKPPASFLILGQGSKKIKFLWNIHGWAVLPTRMGHGSNTN